MLIRKVRLLLTDSLTSNLCGKHTQMSRRLGRLCGLTYRGLECVFLNKILLIFLNCIKNPLNVNVEWIFCLFFFFFVLIYENLQYKSIKSHTSVRICQALFTKHLHFSFLNHWDTYCTCYSLYTIHQLNTDFTKGNVLSQHLFRISFCFCKI